MIFLYAISKQEYDVTKTEKGSGQLDMMKSFVYSYEAQKSYAKGTVKHCLRKY